MGNCLQKPNELEAENSSGNSQMNAPVKTSENAVPIANHEDMPEVYIQVVLYYCKW